MIRKWWAWYNPPKDVNPWNKERLSEDREEKKKGGGVYVRSIETILGQAGF